MSGTTALTGLVDSLEKVDLFTRDAEGRSYCALALHALLQRRGMDGEARRLKRHISKKLPEQAERFGVANLHYRYKFLREFSAFVFQAMERGALNPASCQPHLQKVEDETAALRGSILSPPPVLWLMGEYAGFAASSRDAHYLERAWEFLEKISTEEEEAEDWCSRAWFALARGFSETGAVLQMDVTGRVAAALEHVREPMQALRGLYLMHETAQGASPLLGAPPSREDVRALAEKTAPGPQRSAAWALASALASRAGHGEDADAFLENCLAEVKPGFLLFERGRAAERAMGYLADAALRSREPRHLEAMEKFLYAIKPRHGMFQDFAYGAFRLYVETLLRLYVETGEGTPLQAARRALGSSAPPGAMLMMAGALLQRGEHDEALRVLYRMEDEQRGLHGFALEALACRGKGDTGGFITALERGMSHAELTPGDGGSQAGEYMDMLFDAAVESGRARFFRLMAALARRRYGCSDVRYRLEIQSALGLMAIGARSAQPDLTKEGSETLQAMPAVKRLQGWLAWHGRGEAAAVPSTAEGG